MNRLLVSAIGVLLTFCWIIYTAPDRPEKVDRIKNEPIKKINKSGSNSRNKLEQPISANNIKHDTLKKEFTLLYANAITR